MLDPTPPPATPPPAAAIATPPRIALAHDWLVGFRGGEAVLEAIAQLIINTAAPAGLYAMFVAPGRHRHGPLGGLGRPDGTPLALESFGPAHASWLNRLPGGPGPLRRWLLPLYPSAVADLTRRLAAHHRREPIDLLISTSSAAIKGLAPPSGVPHLAYCHTPARYLWSQTTEYARGRAGSIRRLGLSTLGRPLRAWDRRTAANVTRFLANSTHTAAEIRRCYGRDAEVVFPPVNTDFFTPDPAVARADHWLCAGALEPYKRVDLLIHAANQARQPLTIIGDGSQAAHLRTLAGPTVRFLGRVDNDRLRREFRAARLLVFPQVEDFGIVAVEAQACGTPVLAFRAGGALDTVLDGRTGAFFDQPTPAALIAAAAVVPAPDATTARACRAHAETFGPARFARSIAAHIHELLSVPRP